MTRFFPTYPPSPARTLAILTASALALAACQATPGTGDTAATAPATAPTPPMIATAPPAPASAPPAPSSAIEALNAYYASIDPASLPTMPAGVPMPASDQVITRVLLGSCNDEEKENPAFATMAEEDADLLIMLGDNVYGDVDDVRGRVNNEPELDEVRESFADFAAQPEFQAVRANMPVMAAWDDHDYGANDAGGDFPFKVYAERIHETFWGLADEDAGAWPGTYHARTFGPEGQRTQVIVLDTRFFRSPLRRTDEWNAKGKERYIPLEPGSKQDMLGAAQWTWLENQLQEPADVRIIASSIQISTTDGHGYEHWNNMPEERARLFDLIDSTGAEGVVFVSGDRHTSFLYRLDDALDYPVHEITASSLNLSFRDESPEQDSAQLGAGFAKTNFGAVEIDWDTREIALSLHDEAGTTVRTTRFPIPTRG